MDRNLISEKGLEPNIYIYKFLIKQTIWWENGQQIWTAIGYKVTNKQSVQHH